MIASLRLVEIHMEMDISGQLAPFIMTTFYTETIAGEELELKPPQVVV